MRKLKVYYKAILLVIFLIVSWHFGQYLVEVGEEGLQMDYAAMYSAGKSLNENYSPYENNFDKAPKVWDGIAYHRHSRFLYPPPAGNFFQLMAMSPYSFSKFAWIFLNLLGIGLAIFLAGKCIGLQFNQGKILVLGIFTFLYYPLQILIERGQIDGILILLLVAGIYLLIKNKKLNWLAGVLFALATLFKLYLGALLFFLFARKKWDSTLGFVGGIGVLFAIGILLNGQGAVMQYFGNRLPTIMEHGEKGPEGTTLTYAEYAPLFEGIDEKGFTNVEDKIYKQQLFSFNSLVPGIQYTKHIINSLGIRLGSNSIISVITILILLVLLHQMLGKIPLTSDYSKFSYWSIALIIVLFGSPLTWTMSMVWLIPMLVIPILILEKTDLNNNKISLVFLGIGFGCVMIPDSTNFLIHYPDTWSGIINKYVLGMGLITVGLFQSMRPQKAFEKMEKGVRPAIVKI